MKCQVCGKFRKDNELVKLYDDYMGWLECKYCLCEADLETYFPKEEPKTKES